MNIKHIKNGALAKNAVETQTQELMVLPSPGRAYSSSQGPVKNESFTAQCEQSALNCEEAAKFLGIKEGKLNKLARSGEVLSYKIGSRRIYRREDLVQYQQELVDKESRSHLRTKKIRSNFCLVFTRAA